MEGVIIKKINKFTDDRGWLAEVWRNDDINFKPAMAYASITKPGVIRGPHEHNEQSDCFVFIGPGTFEVHLWDHRDGKQRTDLPVSKTAGEYIKIKAGIDEPTLIIIPPGVVHGYKNISDIDALSMNLPDKLFKGKDKAEETDEIRWEEKSNSNYKII